MTSLIMYRKAAALGLLCAAAMGCDSGDSPQGSGRPEARAKADFWDAFGAGDPPAVLDAHRRMVAAFDARSDDHELARLIGFTNIFLTAYDAVEPSEEPAYRADALKYTELAVQLAGDPRTKVYNGGFWGGTLYTTGARRGDEAMAKQGRDVLEAVAREIPAFGLLTRAVVMRQAPRDSADWAASLESAFLFYERCTGRPIDRARPDLTPALARPFADPDSSCGNWEHAPHGIQGALLHLGDSLVKNDQPDAARPVYEIIEKTEGYEGWAFAGLVKERLASDLSQRARLYDEGDPFDQPEVGADCLACHRR